MSPPGCYAEGAELPSYEELRRRRRRTAERVAADFHETYERLAPAHGYETREASAKPWAEVPEQNRELMVAVVVDLLDRGVIIR